MRLLKKLLHNRYTIGILWKPIYEWEKKQSLKAHEIRPQIFHASPLSTQTSSDTYLTIFTYEREIDNACWTAYSILQQIPDLGLRFLLEQPLTEASIHKVQKLFPDAQFLNYKTVEKSFTEILPNFIVNFAQKSPVGRKLLMILYAQKQSSLLYSDADVLCFDSMPEVAEAVKNGDINLHLRELTGGPSYEPKMLSTIEKAGYSCVPHMNSGFMYIRQNSLNESIAEELLSSPDNFDVENWWVEQTILATLMEKAGSKALSAERYLVSEQGQWIYERDVNYKALALRHFISPVRHMMYTQGMCFLSPRFNISS